MAEAGERVVFLCSCERSMPLDTASVARACGKARLEVGDQFCRAGLDRVRAALAGTAPITIGCTQEAPLFREAAEDAGYAGDLAFANVREAAGWSGEAAAAGPKMAALLAAAAESVPPTPMVSMESRGVALVYGCDAVAIEAAEALADRLDVTVLLTRPGDVVPPRSSNFPVLRGTIRNLKGHLGAFEAAVDDFAQPAPSSRGALRFGPARHGATSRADIVLDLSGERALVPAPDSRDGYLRADPGSPAAVARAILKAADLVGTFDKPRYITFEPSLCAHSRSRITGCTRCLSQCPTGAITPAGDHVAIDPHVCAGCGSCAAVCPTGAASYALPPVDALLRRLRTLVRTYAAAGGRDAVLLLHDERHGTGLIDMLARLGDGLPANVLPLAVNEITELGLEVFASAAAWGATGLVVLAPAKPKHDLAGLSSTLALARTLFASLGYGALPAALVETDDPDGLAAALAGLGRGQPARQPSAFLPVGAKRGVLTASVVALRDAAPAPVDRVPLAAGAPFGGLVVDTAGCTLCLSCVAACPTGAISDNPERPTLRFAESACVQCGLCAATCPEKVISLAPRLDFPALTAPPVTLKEEEPYACISCGKPFGTRSTVERIIAKLEAKRHWMFSGAHAGRLDLVRLCDDCRVERVMNESLDPFAGPARPRPRTSDDYLEHDPSH